MRAGAEADKTSKVEGTVSTASTAAPLYVAAAKVQIIGPVTLQTETDGDGKFAFGELPAGSYTLTA
ncbi:MAG TPA: carboxypeptidase regulatory-like domain-containing protein, partial [Silvibacterium sp.]|nr:carboxypeptidase regulatory-like domain-containing protein [Silvibacterium sp.]